jgi:hypothetical protein
MASDFKAVYIRAGVLKILGYITKILMLNWIEST